MSPSESASLPTQWQHAGGMNGKARKDDVWRKLTVPAFMLLDAVLKTEILAARLFKSFRTTENVRKVLETVYVNTDAVDDELVDLICKPGAQLSILAQAGVVACAHTYTRCCAPYGTRYRRS